MGLAGIETRRRASLTDRQKITKTGALSEVEAAARQRNFNSSFGTISSKRLERKRQNW